MASSATDLLVEGRATLAAGDVARALAAYAGPDGAVAAPLVCHLVGGSPP